jgi:hypothetical protein
MPFQKLNLSAQYSLFQSVSEKEASPNPERETMPKYFLSP